MKLNMLLTWTNMLEYTHHIHNFVAHIVYMRVYITLYYNIIYIYIFFFYSMTAHFTLPGPVLCFCLQWIHDLFCPIDGYCMTWNLNSPALIAVCLCLSLPWNDKVVLMRVTEESIKWAIITWPCAFVQWCLRACG